MVGNKVLKAVLACVDTNSEFMQTNVYINVIEIYVILIKQSL